MSYLLDTCVISELVKNKPSDIVVRWVSMQEEFTLYISVLTISEINKGIERLPKSRKKDKLQQWVNGDLQYRFKNRIINFNINTATIWGKIQAHSELSGKTMPAIDGMIAATGIAHNLTVVTRNTIDMKISGVPLLNPWKKQ